MSKYNSVILELKEFAHALNMGYITSFLQEKSLREVTFAKHIVASLYNSRKLLAFLSKMHSKDLEDCLKTHKIKYIRSLENQDNAQEEIATFEENLQKIFQALNALEVEEGIENSEIDLISERFYKIVKYAQLLFAEQSYNQQIKDNLQANALVLSLDKLDYDAQKKLLEKLLLVKEIWCIDNAIEANIEGIKYQFQYNPQQKLELKGGEDIDTIFNRAITLLTSDSLVLEQLSDEQLIHLYDRIKNYEWNCPTIPSLLLNLHDESQFRYSYNRLNDSGYELLNRFQSYDAIIHQIVSLEYAIVESYLINNSGFFNKFLKLLYKHTDNIRALGLNKDKNLNAILKKIETCLYHMPASEKENNQAALKSLKGKLGNSLESHVRKRYIDLDKFTIHTLQDKYESLFQNLENLLDDNVSGRQYLHDVLVSKLTHDFYLPNLSNSVDKLRNMVEYRKEVRRKLKQLNLVNIFLGKGMLNKIQSLDFKKISINPKIKVASDYVNLLIKEIIGNCSAFQLEVLYRPLVSDKELSKTQLYMKEEIIKEIHQRTSITKMIYSVVRGRKKEYDHLKHIKKTIKGAIDVSEAVNSKES